MADEKPGRHRPQRRERPRLPLVFKLFGLTALLIAVVVGAAIGVTIQRANAVATTTVNEAIGRAAALFKDLEQKRLKELRLGALTVARDPAFYAYIENALQPAAPAEAAESGGAAAAVEGAPPAAPVGGEPAAPPQDPQSASALAQDAPILREDILDQLQQKKELLGTDLVMLTDDQGVLIARTDKPAVVGGRPEDLYETQPLLKELVDGGEQAGVTGTIESDGKLYHAAIAPLSVGASPVSIAYLVNAYAIDERFANQISQTTKAGVLFLPRRSGEGGDSVPRSTNAPSAANLRQMREVTQLLTTGAMIRPHSVTIDGSLHVMTGEPLTGGNQPLGAAVFVRPLAAELAPFQEIETTLLVAGGAGLLLAFILSWMISRRLTKPIERLANVAQSVTEGDYSAELKINRSDELGILARSFAKMIATLRDKAELEELYEQMASRVDERARSTPVQPAIRREGTLLVTDLRGLPASIGGGDAEEVVSFVRQAMAVQHAEVRRQEGSLLAIVGHRLVTQFPGERGVIHAIRAARAISEELALHSGSTPLTVGVGIASGEYVTGSVELAEDTGTTIVGNAALLALLLAWEAPGGHAYISLESAQAAGPDVLSSSTRDEVRLRWLPAPIAVVAVPLMSLTTGVMRSMSTAPGDATMKLEAAAVPAHELAAGSTFANRYEIEQILGRGGMGIVYKATDRQLDETVAIKTLPNDVMGRSDEDLERFKREIRLARKITHRNVLRTYDYGEADGTYFISMEYVRGYTLADLLVQTPKMSPRVAIGIARQICRGLQAAHEQSIIHRDIKPQNVLIDHKGEVKLMDFGIARMAEASEAMTAAGLIVGTPHYMSPEQVQGRQLDARSDVYAMGVMLFEMLCGERPFDSPALTAILTAHITEPPRPPIELRPEIGRDVNQIILKCLAKEPAQRYTDAGDLLAALDRLQPAAAAA